jgi:hypothetical protein
MHGVFFGIANHKYDSGCNATCAINPNNQIIEVHTATAFTSGLWYSYGQLVGSEISWVAHDSIRGDDGADPSVAINAGGQILEVHTSGFGRLWYWIGQVTGENIVWSGHDQYDDGYSPSIALRDGGQYVEVHSSRPVLGRLWYNVGYISNSKLVRTGHGDYTDGVTPSIAANALGLVVEVHDSGVSKLYYRVGQISAGTIQWLGSSTQYDDGTSPSVALTDDGYVIETHKSQSLSSLYQRIGRVNGGSIDWIDLFGQGSQSYYFDDGAASSVACNSAAAIQVHSSGLADSLYATASWWLDRSDWMGKNLATLGTRPLKQLVMPATHDSGMYLGGWSFSILGKTQDLDLYGQLQAGVRYFDLRPANNGGNLIIYHGDWSGIHVDGPPLLDVLSDIRKFLAEGHRELVILKFSHYGGFDQAAFEHLCREISQNLSDWIYQGDPPPGGRLADTTLGSFLGRPGSGSCLVVCDGSFSPPPGMTKMIKSYRDWFAADPQNGQLTLFDVYSKTTDMNTMMNGGPPNPDPELPNLPRGQFPKFADFNGTCLYQSNGVSIPCDLFLSSWTLTPPTAVWPFSRTANAALGEEIARLGANSKGYPINLLYVDYAEYARVCDIAVLRNGLIPHAS